ncbi:MAG TPA: cyclic nucleotide-binding domain-containing protein [Chitinispirillaceae bacterium]|nr:cyclic nucleotide-binding domain-containing protein [Chitinispirillaceae bacterium]
MEHPIWSYFFRITEEKKANIELLKSLPVFESLTNSELIQIERILHERVYAKGEVVFNEGEPGAGMYIVSKGEIEIIQNVAESQKMHLANISERSFFGEIALLDELPRSASAVARCDTVLLGFSKPDLENLLARNQRLGIKILSNLSRLTCRRLIKANENLETLQIQLNQVTGEGGKRE